MSLTPGVVKGIATANFQALLIEPTWTDVRDALQLFPKPIEGAGVRVTPMSDTAPAWGQGDSLWSQDFSFICDSHTSQAALFRHIENCMGRVRSFWVPSWRTDFRIYNDAQPASRNILYVQPVDFEFVYEDDRFGIFIQLNDGTYHIYRLVGYNPVVGRLTLNGALDTTFPIADVVRCSLIRRVRFDSDSFQWSYRTDTIVQISATVVEVKKEGVFI